MQRYGLDGLDSSSDLETDGTLHNSHTKESLLRVVMPEFPKLSDLTTAQLITYFQQLFAIGDINGDGVLQPIEFAEVLIQACFTL